jgi:hypothetical protein
MAGSAREVGGVLIYIGRAMQGGRKAVPGELAYVVVKLVEDGRPRVSGNGQAIGYGRLEPNLRRAAGLLSRVAKRELAG